MRNLGFSHKREINIELFIYDLSSKIWEAKVVVYLSLLAKISCIELSYKIWEAEIIDLSLFYGVFMHSELENHISKGTEKRVWREEFPSFVAVKINFMFEPCMIW